MIKKRFNMNTLFDKLPKTLPEGKAHFRPRDLIKAKFKDHGICVKSFSGDFFHLL